MKRQILVVVLISLATVTFGQDKSPAHDGSWWNSLSAANKVGFVLGYTEASSYARDVAYFRCLADGNGGIIPEKVPNDTELDRCSKRVDVEINFPSFNGMIISQIVEGADKFYGDYRNKTIRVNLALRFASDELSGKSSGTIQAEVEGWRKVARENQ
jgi:hypothetical protein